LAKALTAEPHANLSAASPSLPALAVSLSAVFLVTMALAAVTSLSVEV